jgi:hypothetical protein
MKKNIQHLSMVLALSAFCAATVHAASDAGPQKRTWGQYLSQKAAANNLLASKDSRELAKAQLELGTLQMQDARAKAKLEAQQEASRRQAEALRLKAEMQAKAIADKQRAEADIARLRGTLAQQKMAIQAEMERRRQTQKEAIQAEIDRRRAARGGPVSAGSVSAVPAPAASAAVAPAPVVPTPISIPTQSIRVDDVPSKVSPEFYKYLEGRGPRKFAIDEFATKGISLTDEQIKKYQKDYNIAKSTKGMVTLPV